MRCSTDTDYAILSTRGQWEMTPHLFCHQNSTCKNSSSLICSGKNRLQTRSSKPFHYKPSQNSHELSWLFSYDLGNRVDLSSHFVDEATPIFLVRGCQGSFATPSWEIVLTSTCASYAEENFPMIQSSAILYSCRLTHMTSPDSDDQLPFTGVGWWIAGDSGGTSWREKDYCISEQLKEERCARKASQPGTGTTCCFKIHAKGHFCISGYW